MLALIKKEIAVDSHKKTEPNLNETFFTHKHFPSAVREWNNSIYLYNKNNLNLVPSTTRSTMDIIKSFFSLFNESLEKKLRSKRFLLRFRRLSSNKIYLGNGEFKHTNNKVLINIYIFNRQIHNYLSKFKNTYLKKIYKKKYVRRNILRKLKLINKKGINYIKRVNKNKYMLINILNIVKKNTKYKINTFKSLSNYTELFYKNLINLTIKKLRLYFIYKQLIYLNRSRLNYTFLHILKKRLEKVYNKNVEFNLINLKRFYLNSDILFESIKLKLARNRRKIGVKFNKLTNKVKILDKGTILKPDISTYSKVEQLKEKECLKKSIFNKLKYKHVTGFRLEANGRLTRRYTAARSLSKLKYKGNLLNLNTSFKGVSSVILKGNLESNLQYSKLSSKTRIGSFGIKGWVSGN